MVATPRVQAVLAAAVAVVLLAGVVAAVGLDGDGRGDDDRIETGARATTTTTTTPSALGESGGAPATATTGSASAPTAPTTTTTATAVPPPAAKELGAADPPATRPSPAGAYAYRLQTGDDARRVTTTVDDRGTAGGVTKQLVTVETDQGSIASDVEWRSDALVVTRSRFRMGSVDADCDWEPDWTEAALPLARGVTWRTETSCQTTILGQPATFKLVNEGKVVDARRLQVTAGTFDTWVIASSQHLEVVAGSFTATQDQQGTTWVAPAIGMTVRSSGTGRQSSPQGSTEQHTELELLELPKT